MGEICPIPFSAADSTIRDKTILSSLPSLHQLVPKIELIPSEIEIEHEVESKFLDVLTTSGCKHPVVLFVGLLSDSEDCAKDVARLFCLQFDQNGPSFAVFVALSARKFVFSSEVV